MKQSTKEKLKDIFVMFLIFFKVGAFSFGGGYAMLTMIEREIVDKKNWLTRPQLMDIFAIAESTPGAISINIATFVGTKRGGILGGIITTLGLVLPSFIIIVAISYVIDLVYGNVWVGYFFRGIRVGVLVLITKAAIGFLTDMKKKPLTIGLMIVTFLLAILTSINIIYIILASILISIIVVSANNIRKKKLHIIDLDARIAEVQREAALSFLETDDYSKSLDEDDTITNSETAYSLREDDTITSSEAGEDEAITSSELADNLREDEAITNSEAGGDAE